MKKILFFIPILTLMFNSVFAMPTKTNDVIIADYPFTNRVNELSVSEKQEITKILTACADVMRFNIRNYDYDKLFKYVLYTHKNFQILTDIPADAMVETQIDNSVRDFAQRLSYQGMNLDMYMQYTGMTMDALRAQFAEQAKKQLSGSLVLEAIQKAEGIEAGPEEVELELVDMSKKYNMELDKLKELLGDAEKESIKKDLEIQKTITMIVNNAQVK